jgi:hypothetical protein
MRNAVLSVLFCGFCFVASGQSAVPLTNETIINLVQAGVPTQTIINTIASAEKTDFTFVGAPLQRLTSARVPDEVFKAMAAKSNNRLVATNTPPQAPRPALSPSPAVQSQPTTPQGSVLDNEALIKLAKAGMSDEILIGLVNSQPGRYSLAADNLIALKQAPISDRVIAAMIAKNTGASSSLSFSSPVVTGEPILLHDGTPVRLRLTRNLSSGDAKTGDMADFETLEDIKIDDVVVIARGATAIATITRAEAKKRMARGGHLDINLDYVRIANGDKVAIRAIKETSGGGHTGAMTGAIVATSLVVWPAAPFFLFMHGKDSTIPKGTELTAYVDGEIKLDRQKLVMRQ